MYTKKQIADGIVKFINNDLMTDEDVMNNKHLRFSLCMAKKALHTNPDVLDSFMKNPIVSSVVQKEGDEYDIDLFVKTMKNVLSEYDSYSIMIPGIPMFAPKESSLKITAQDVDKLVSYIKPDLMVQPQ